MSKKKDMEVELAEMFESLDELVNSLNEDYPARRIHAGDLSKAIISLGVCLGLETPDVTRLACAIVDHIYEKRSLIDSIEYAYNVLEPVEEQLEEDKKKIIN